MAKKLKPTLLNIMQSILAAMFGVQSQSNRERDFNSGKAWHYILGGIAFVILLIIILLFIINIVL